MISRPHLGNLISIISIFIFAYPGFAVDKSVKEYLLKVSDLLIEKVEKIQGKNHQNLLKYYLSIPEKAHIDQIMTESTSPLSRWYLLRIDDSTPYKINALQQNSQIIHLQENNIYRLHSNLPNDSLYKDQWYHQQIQAEESWSNFTLDPNIILAIIDTGIDYHHPDLQNSSWINLVEDLNENNILDPDDLNGIDDDENGYVDDVIGWDFTDAPRLADIGDFIEPDNDPMDEFPGGHGTKIAGIIAAQTNNSRGISALLPGTRVMNIRAGTASGYLEEDDVARAVLYAMSNGARVINMSFGDTILSRFLKDVIEYAYSKGIVIVASAGNSGTDDIHYPSGLAETISVGATDRNDQPAGFSNRGQTIDLVAPGVEIIAPKLGGGYEYAGGTSFSAPMVTATVGMILSNNPDYSVEQIRNLLKTSADDKAPTGWDLNYGAGRLNMLRASEIGKESSLFIHHPRSGISTAETTIPIVITAQDPDLININLSYGMGTDPREWYDLVADHLYQIVEDTITIFSTVALPDTTIVLRLRFSTWNEDVQEYRSVIEIDRTMPVISNLSHLSLLDGDDYASLIQFETDDITSADILYRPLGSTDSFRSIHLAYETRNHSYLFSPAGDIEYYIHTENLSGLVNVADNQGKFFELSNPTTNIYLEEFIPLSASLPAGYMLSQATDFDRDGEYEIVLSVYDENGAFGPVSIYEYSGGQFVLRMETSFKAIPRSAGDTDSDGKQELALGYGQKSYLLEAGQVDHWPSEVVWSDTGAFWISQITDLDKDGQKEILGREDQNYILYESTGDNQFGNKTVFANPSPGENQYGPPRSAVSDLDNDGYSELFFGDYDGDMIVYENTSDNLFESRGYIHLSLEDATDYFFAANIFDLNNEVLIVGTHTGTDTNYEHEFSARYWHYSVLDAIQDNMFEIRQNIAVYGYSAVKDFDSGYNAGAFTAGQADYVFFAPHPDLYIFKARSDSLIPVWHKRDVNTNTVIIHDFDKNGISEFYFNSGDQIIGYQKDQANRPRAPGDVRAFPIDTSAVEILWNEITDADRYIVYRGMDKDHLSKYDSTIIDQKYTDISVINGRRYYYAIQTVAYSFDEAISKLSVTVSAIPNLPPFVDTLMVKNERQIEVYYSEPMDQNTLQAANFELEKEENPVTSAISMYNGHAILLTFSKPFRGSDTYTLRMTGLRDSNRTLLSAGDSVLVFMFVPKEKEKPYVQEWRFDSARILYIKFNVSMDIGTVLEPDNFELEPSGNVLEIEAKAQSTQEFYLKLSHDTYDIGAGVTTYLVMTNIKNYQGDLLEEGNRIALIAAPSDIEDMIVYPQPITPENDWMMFAKIAPGTSIKIYDTNGHFIAALQEEDQNGGVRWDLHDQAGRRVSTGVYIYYATFDNQIKLGKFSIVR
jgi:subtilisin family serine protease